MLSPANDTRLTQEKLIAEAIRDVASEIRLVDLTDLVSYFRIDRMGPVEALINSALELYFKPGRLSFAGAGSAHINWNGSIDVRLDFEFRHDGLSIFFTMVMRSDGAAIHINYVSVDGHSNLAAAQNLLERTATALSEARLRPVENHLAWWRQSSLARSTKPAPPALANFLT